MHQPPTRSIFFFFNDTATTEIYTLSLHDALPISTMIAREFGAEVQMRSFEEELLQEDSGESKPEDIGMRASLPRSEEHTSELQSPCNLVCRLLLEKKKRTRVR